MQGLLSKGTGKTCGFFQVWVGERVETRIERRQKMLVTIQGRSCKYREIFYMAYELVTTLSHMFSGKNNIKLGIPNIGVGFMVSK